MEEEQNEIEDHFEALLNDIEELQDEVEDDDEDPDENGVVLDIDVEALPDDIRLEVLKQTNESTTAAAWRSSQEQADKAASKSKKQKAEKIKKKKKKGKRSKSESHETEPCGTATGGENVDVFSPLESQEETRGGVYEEKTEKKVRKKRKSKKPKKVTDETEIIEEDISGLMEQDAAGDGEGVKPLSPLEQLEVDLMKAELEEVGTWVQCDNRWCRKWRLLRDVSDPSELPNKWTCNISTDEDFDSCDIPEQTWDKENEENFVYAEFTEGSIVWAKMDGYPWWPAMVQNDPDLRTFYESEDINPMMPLYYHVVFLDKKQSRAWVRKGSIKAFNCNQEEEVVAFPYMAKGQSYKKQRDFALQQAVNAAGMSIEEKLTKFGFKQKKCSKQSQRYHDLQMSMSDDDDFDVPMPKERGSRKKRKVDGENLDDVKPVSKHGKSDVKKKVKKAKSRERTDKDGKKMKKKKTRNDVEKHLKVLPENPKVDFRFRSSSQKCSSGSQNRSSQKNDRVYCTDNENEGDVLDLDDADDDHVDDGVVTAENKEVCSDEIILKEGKICGEVTEKDDVVEKTQEYDMEVPDTTGYATVRETGNKGKMKCKPKKKEMIEKDTEGKIAEIAENGDGKKKKSAKLNKKEPSECAIGGEKKLVKSKEKVMSDNREKKAVKPKKKVATSEGDDGEKKVVKPRKKEGVDGEKKLKKNLLKKFGEEGVGKDAGMATDNGDDGEKEPKKIMAIKKRKKNDIDKENVKLKEKKKKKLNSENTEDRKKKKAVSETGEVKEKKIQKKRIKSESEGEEKRKRKKVKGKGDPVKTEASADSELTRDAAEKESVIESVKAAEDNAKETDIPGSKSKISWKKVQGSPCSSQPKVCSSPSAKSDQKAEKSPIQAVAHIPKTVDKMHSSPAKAVKAQTALKMEKKVAGPMDRFLVKPKSKFVAPVVSRSTANVKTDTTQTVVKTKAVTPKKTSKLGLRKEKNNDAKCRKESSQNHKVKISAEVHEVFDKDSRELDLVLLEASKESFQCTVPADPRPESPVMEFEDLDKPDSQVLQVPTRCDSPEFDLADNPDRQAMDVGPVSPAMSMAEDESQEMDLDADSQPKHIQESSSPLKVVNES
ncbi:uncharacterized protein LOC135496566 [Lineus longissimus]|uniref:uncharacterized protein LOC135496566 n=1 Tax=Lineus longissimus TaxID=88925 RepID=UPI00315D4C77